MERELGAKALKEKVGRGEEFLLWGDLRGFEGGGEEGVVGHVVKRKI